MSDAIAATHFQAPELEEVERLFPSYKVLGLIACGGMGAVYHAIQTSLDRAVAIKILPREFSVDLEFRAGFESEAKAMAKLNHPNLIGVYDFGEAEGLLFIVMEYVAGKSLFHTAYGSLLDHADTLAIVIGVCHGLAHAHDHGIMHRDIKPSNILLDEHAHPKIGDFGLAGALDREHVEGEQIFGTPGYTAPEVLEPPFTFDQRADIFSVGVMLHELLTGKLPEADPRSASQISHCNHRLDSIIQRAINPDPNRRIPSAIELARELEKIAAKPNRMLRTASTPAAMSVTALTRVSAPAALSSTAVPSRTTRNLPSRPQKLFKAPRTMAKESSGSGAMIFLIIAIVVAAVVYLLMKGASQQPPEQAPSPPTPPPVVMPTPPKPNVVKGIESPEEVLQRARTAIRRRISPAIESYKRDMKANLHGYKNAVETASRKIPSSDRERITAILTENVHAWENDGHRLPQTPPAGFKILTGADELHAAYSKKQDTIRRKFDAEISSFSGIYILELQNQIDKLEKNGNAAAAAALQEEIRAANTNPDRFRTLMMN